MSPRVAYFVVVLYIREVEEDEEEKEEKEINRIRATIETLLFT